MPIVSSRSAAAQLCRGLQMLSREQTVVTTTNGEPLCVLTAIGAEGITELERTELAVHLAEYANLTNRCTYWLNYQVPIWTAILIAISVAIHVGRSRAT